MAEEDESRGLREAIDVVAENLGLNYDLSIKSKNVGFGVYFTFHYF